MTEPRTPLLSVVIPVYNGVQYIPTMIQCFRDQPVQNFELIFVDDGSEDDSLSLLHSYARSEAFPITVVELEPEGVSAARNAGLAQARGQYVSFVDVDDRIVPQYTTLLQELTENGVGDNDLFFFTSERVGPEGPFDGLSVFDFGTPLTATEMLKVIGYDATKFGVYNMFIAREFLEAHEFRFTEGYAYYEDYDFLFRVTARAEKIRYSQNRLYFYLLQEGSAVATFKLERVTCVELLEGLTTYLKYWTPEFAIMFEEFVLPRIWWSVMWQACLAFPLKDALRFGKAAGMREQMKKLSDCEDPKVAYSAKLYLVNPAAFVTAASVAGRQRSRIERTDVGPFLEYFQK
ncbi:MAG: glycosyltransferase [Clostridia bacterium]|nr:glycosyltransferase [Clostridia bacterium]